MSEDEGTNLKLYDLCASMSNRLLVLDQELQFREDLLLEKDNRIVQLEQEIKELRLKCANSETCRSHSAKELRRLRKLLENSSHGSISSPNGKIASEPYNNYSRNEICSHHSSSTNSSLVANNYIEDQFAS